MRGHHLPCPSHRTAYAPNQAFPRKNACWWPMKEQLFTIRLTSYVERPENVALPLSCPLHRTIYATNQAFVHRQNASWWQQSLTTRQRSCDERSENVAHPSVMPIAPHNMCNEYNEPSILSLTDSIAKGRHYTGFRCLSPI